MLFMKYQVKTSYNKAFNWIKSGKISFIGYLNNSSTLIPTKNDIAKLFPECKSLQDYALKIKEINGVYSLIISSENYFIAASDATRFFPLFYTIINNTFCISDDIEFVQEQTHSKEFDNAACLEFLSAAFTCNKHTIYKNVSQIRPAEMLTIENDEIKLSYFYHFSKTDKEISTNSNTFLYQQAKEIIDRSFSKMFTHLRGKEIALPLSGGYDSRLIAYKLREHGFNHVTCFTYGRPTKEVNVSKEVTNKLGFQWHFVEYTNALIKDYHSSKIFKEYYKYASRGTSMFFLQEYPAIKYLFDQNILNKNHIALPGHSGDLIRGAMLYKNYPEHCNKNNLSDILFSKKFIHAPLTKKNKRLLRLNIEEHINELYYNPDLLAYSVLEDWEMKERTSKYIFNSSHAFTYFDIQVFFPLWDMNIIDFFRRLHYSKRINGNLYNDVLKNNYFIPNHLDLRNDIQPTIRDLQKNKIKNILKAYMPRFIKEKRLEKNDWPFYKPMTQYLLRELNENNFYPKTNGNSYLYRILNWYLFKIKEDQNNKEKNQINNT